MYPLRSSSTNLFGAPRLYNSVPDDNSLSNLDALRGVFGACLVARMRKTTLARHSLSMRKPCLESYILESTIGCSTTRRRVNQSASDSTIKNFYEVLTPTKNATAIYCKWQFFKNVFEHLYFGLDDDVRKEVVGGFTWSSFFGLYNVVGLGEFYNTLQLGHRGDTE